MVICSTIRPEILYTRVFKEKFFQCLSRCPVDLKIAVPYIGRIPDWRTVSAFSQFLLRRKCRFLLVTRPPSHERTTLTLEEATMLANQEGVDLLFRIKPTLHSKVYQFTFAEGDRASFIGSANFTQGGFSDNDETVAFFQDKRDNDKVAREIHRLVENSINFQHWQVQNSC